MSREQPPSPSPRMVFKLLGLLVLFFFAGGFLFYRHEAKIVQTEKYNEMKAIADLKIRQIVSWRQEREADAHMYSTDMFRTDIVRWLHSPEDLPDIDNQIRNRFQMLRDYQGYENVILTGPDGRLLLTMDPRLTRLESNTRRLVAQAVSSHRVVFGDFFRCPDCRQIHLDVAAPVLGTDNLPVAVLILRTDPAQFLYPLIQTWPLPSRTAETLIVRRDGDDVLFLNTLRHLSAPPLTLRIPLSKTDFPAVRAAHGQTGLFLGQDYRDMDVLSDIRSIPGSSWFMVAKADTDEILADVRFRGMIIGLGTLMLTLLAGTSAGYLYKHQGKRAFQALYQAESSLREAAADFKTTLYSIGDGVITTDIKGRIREMNPVAERLTGWTESGAKGKPVEAVFRILREETGEPAESPVQKVLEKGIIVGLANHTLLISKDGSRTPIADSGAPIRDENGAITGAVLVFRDQTMERDIEKMLLARLKLLEYATAHSLEELLQKTTDEVCYLTGSPVGFYHFVEPDQKNLTLQAWSTRTIREFCHAEGKGRHYPIDQAGVWVDCVHSKKPVIHNDYNALPHKKGLPDGHAPVVRELVVPIMRSGSVVAILGVGNKSSNYTEKDTEITAYLADVAWEITERKRAEAGLYALTAHQQALLSSIPDIIMEVDINKVYTWANPSGYEFFGEDVIGKEANFYFEGEQPVYDTVKTLFKGNEDTVYLESWQRRKDGQKRLLAWWCRVLKDRQGNVTGALSTARDITDLKTLEDQLRQAQKMESVGRLAGGVAHDFNNMLTVILGYTEMVLEQVDPEQPIFKELQEVYNAAKRSEKLTRQLLAFARKQTISPIVLNLNDTISSMLKLLRKLIGEDIALAWKPRQKTWPVKMDPAQIDQILANLLVNAKDAIGGVGAVTIETDNVEFDIAYCAENVGFVPGKYAMIAVSDTGAGMDKKTLDHLFEPFFTTKDMGKGTGLGLATVFGIVKQNKGFINVYSEPGQGTTFKIYLPRTESGVAEEAIAVSSKNLMGTETVLLVEDEESILHLGTTILTQYGYTVLSTKSPSEALIMAQHSGEPIHLLVTDVVMPEMNGKELMERISAVRPGIKCLFMSGYTANAIAHHGVLDENIHFLQKPFSVADIAKKVREALDGG